MENQTVAVAMSGGVDSSVAALLLKKQGYKVLGIMLKLWSGENAMANKCCTPAALEDAREVADILDIPFYVLDFRHVFKKTIVDYFLENTSQGFTPNPCIICNQCVRFTYLLQEAIDLGADFLATGHYAQVKKEDKNFLLYQSFDKGKDQSYMLYRLTQRQLEKTLFPLGSYTKVQIRKIAEEEKLPVFQRRDSQDLCFLGNQTHSQFLEKHIQKEHYLRKEGDVVTLEGEVIGTHQGLIFYTVGQRKGLGIAWKHPLYVIKKDIKNNILIVGKKKDSQKKVLVASNIHFINENLSTQLLQVTARIRYHSDVYNVSIYLLENRRARIEFEHPIEDISAGQSIVFYREGLVLGGGFIEKETS